MKTVIVLLACAIFTAASLAESPFTLSVVPSLSDSRNQRIALRKENPLVFYVILKNESKRAQIVYEDWNSWGYQNVSFELTTEDGRQFTVTKRPHDFTRNFASTFQIEPGEHQVFPIIFDKDWITKPEFTREGYINVLFKAIYEVPATRDSSEHKVWAGRVESKAYQVTLQASK